MRWRLLRAPSLAARLAAAFALSILIVAAVFLSVQVALVQRFAGFITEQSLKGQSNDIAEAITRDAAGRVMVRLGARDAFGFDAFFANLAYRVLAMDGQVLASSTGRLDSLLGDVPLLQQDGYYTTRVVDGTNFHVAAVLHRVAGTDYMVQMGRSDRFAELAQEAITPAVSEAVGLLAAVSVLVLAVLSYLGVRSVLRPIRRASDAAGAVRHGNLSARLPLEDLPSEIRPLVLAFNEVLDRLEVAFASQQRFFANAAHELKTPIALLRAQLETAQGAAAPQTLRDLDAMGRTVNQLLHIAEVSGGRTPDRRPVGVAEVVHQVMAFLSWRAQRLEVSLQLSVPAIGLQVMADAGELFVLLKNLVENAIEHSPAGGIVHIELLPQGLAVHDQGPGVADEYRAAVFERFWRVPDNGRPGSGLGLAICQEIAHAHGWHITCGRSAAGGAVFTLLLEPPALAGSQV